MERANGWRNRQHIIRVSIGAPNCGLSLALSAGSRCLTSLSNVFRLASQQRRNEHNAPLAQQLSTDGSAQRHAAEGHYIGLLALACDTAAP